MVPSILCVHSIKSRRQSECMFHAKQSENWNIYIQEREQSALYVIIAHCSTFQSSSANPSSNSSPPRDRGRSSPWGGSKVHIQGQKNSPAGAANRAKGSKSPGGCSADSGSAQRRSCRSSTPSWWGSRSRTRRRRRRSPVESSCLGPRGCRASATLVRSRRPGRRRVDGEGCSRQDDRDQ